MDVFILGGTGFIGYHATMALLGRGHRVHTLALPPLPEEDLFPAGVTIHLGDFNAMPDQELLELMGGCDGVVFAAGVDDRVTPKKPAYPFFHKANVLAAKRFFTLAKTAGASRGVLLNSYFAYFARTWPELRMAEDHPYIRSRCEQEDAVLALADEDLRVALLELPYIFGRMPGRKPLWLPLVKYIRWPLNWLFYSGGGSAMVSVKTVARAILGALTNLDLSGRFQIGDENLTWSDFLERLSNTAGRQKKIVTLPKWLLRIGAGAIKLWHGLQGRESGLEPLSFMDVQTREAFFDPKPAQEALGFTGGDLDQAFRDTILGCGYPVESE